MNTNNQYGYKKVNKVFFAWQDEQEEKWLQEMAADGWMLDKVAPYTYSFKKGDPRKVVYRLDFKNNLDQDYQEYLDIFKDSGWQLLTTFTGWHYFTIQCRSAVTPEIYNSARTRAQKYRRTFYLSLPMFLLIMSPIYTLINTQKEATHPLLHFGFTFLFIGIVLYGIFGTMRMWVKIRQLESGSLE